MSSSGFESMLPEIETSFNFRGFYKTESMRQTWVNLPKKSRLIYGQVQDSMHWVNMYCDFLSVS